MDGDPRDGRYVTLLVGVAVALVIQVAMVKTGCALWSVALAAVCLPAALLVLGYQMRSYAGAGMVGAAKVLSVALLLPAFYQGFPECAANTVEAGIVGLAFMVILGGSQKRMPARTALLSALVLGAGFNFAFLI
jgi:hypothetical protein